MPIDNNLAEYKQTVNDIVDNAISTLQLKFDRNYPLKNPTVLASVIQLSETVYKVSAEQQIHKEQQ